MIFLYKLDEIFPSNEMAAVRWSVFPLTDRGIVQ